MAFNNTTGVPSPSPLSPSPSASPSVNVTLVNITRSELPLVLRPDDPAFPLYVAVWTAIACAVAVMCARGVQYIVGRFVQVMINCCMRLSRSSESLAWREVAALALLACFLVGCASAGNRRSGPRGRADAVANTTCLLPLAACSPPARRDARAPGLGGAVNAWRHARASGPLRAGTRRRRAHSKGGEASRARPAGAARH